MNRQEFNFKKIAHMDKKNLKFAVDRSNYIDGWDDCVRDLEKELGIELDAILKIKKDRLCSTF